MSYSSSYDEALYSSLHKIASAYYSKFTGSRTTPNYLCPGCRSKVFFFQSGDGGKVLFDSLGKPWPKHECLVIQYLRKQSELKISPGEWLNVTGLCATPSTQENLSIFAGVISGKTTGKQDRIELEVLFDEPILIKDIYLDVHSNQGRGTVVELLVLLDDGRHKLLTAKLLNTEPFHMEDLSGKKPYKIQSSLL